MEHLQTDQQNIYLYDIETYPNHFLAVFKHYSEQQDGKFTLFTDKDLDALKKFLNRQDLMLIGYNNFTFDDVILKAILSNQVNAASEIYELADCIINQTESNFDIKRLTYYSRNEWNNKTSPWICIDLFQILGGKKLAGSLKKHEIRLGMLNVMDLPITPGTTLTDEQCQRLIPYCKHDVDATEKVLHDTYQDVLVRIEVNNHYPYLTKSALRRTNSSIAEIVVAHELQTRAGISKKDILKPALFPFDPALQIDSSIQFQSEHNQQLLDQLKALKTFEPEEWLQGLNSPFVFKSGQHNIELGRGGAHTLIANIQIQSKNIVEFDVASYYPSLLRKINSYPSGLAKQWIDILNELTDSRLAAKASGNSAKAEVYKIIINSIYGKLEDKFSINRDPSLQLQVVLNGQLFLIMLMEQFDSAGFQVISANTDGIYINAEDRLDQARGVAKKWEEHTGFSLSHNTSTHFVAASVNEYALYHPDKGWYHKKGRFSPSMRTKPSIVTDAVLNHLSTQESVEEFIRRSTNLLEFLYSSSIRGGNVVKVVHGSETVQKNNRWYRTLQGYPIEKQVLQKDDSIKIAKIPNSDSSTVVNYLSSTDIPKDLDYDHYIRAAQKLLDEILSGKQPNRPVSHSKLIKNAIKAQKLGFIVVPKGWLNHEKANVRETFSDHIIDYWKNTPLEKANWGGYTGFGSYTGKQFGIVGIDIDYPSEAKKAGLYELLEKHGVVCWHGDHTAENVRNGDCKGTLLFKYDGDALHTTGARCLLSNGFEILYGNKVVQLAGQHPDGDDYQYKGSLKPIPKKLLNYLEWIVPEQPKRSTHTPDPSTTLDKKLEQFLELANKDPQHIKAGGKLGVENTGQWGIQLTGVCVGQEEHTNRQGDHKMRLFVREGEIRSHCFHQSCWIVRKNWTDRLKKEVCVTEKVSVNPENLIIHNDEQEIAAALRNQERYKLIIAATGSGKTHQVVTYIASCLDSDSGIDDKFAIICSTKDQMIQIGERFGNILESNNINELGIDLIEATGSIKINKAKSIRSVRDQTRVAITHYTYVSRRGFSQYYYVFLDFIDNTTQVFIDEIDAFVESQTAHYPLGSRKRTVSTAGKHKNIHVLKCGVYTQSNNCINCIQHKYDGNQLDINDYLNLDYLPVNQSMTDIQREQLAHIELDDRLVSRVNVNTTEVTMLKQQEEPGELLFAAEDEPQVDFSAVFFDHLDSAFLPTVHRPFIKYEDEEISREDLIARFNLNENNTISTIPDTERAKLRFPCYACNVLTVTMIDRRPLLWMGNAKSVTGLSATISPLQEKFVSDVLGEIERFTISPNADRKMDKIIVIGMERSIPIKMYIDEHLKFEKMFRFRETKRAAEKDFEILRNTNISIRLGYDKRKYMLTSEENEYGSHKILQTYAYSSLGRGIDFEKYDVVDINASIFKPISAYVTDDPDKIRDLMFEDRANIIKQNVGRILRRNKDKEEAIKIVIVECLESEGELDAIKLALQDMSSEPIESWWVPAFLDNIFLCGYLTQVIKTKQLSEKLPSTYKVLIEWGKQWVEKGLGKTQVKDKLNWQTVMKKLTQEQALEVTQAIDQVFEEHEKSTTRQPTEKEKKLRVRRQDKIQLLMDEGKTIGQIRSHMNVYSGKKPWPDIEQRWFEETLKKMA